MNFDEMSDERADAMAQAMLASWEQAMDEVHRLRAEVERLRAIEAAARAYVDLTEDKSYERPAAWLFSQLQAALAAKEGA